MPRFTDLPKWRYLSKNEKAALKETVAIKSYENYDGQESVSLRELAKGELYQAQLESEADNG